MSRPSAGLLAGLFAAGALHWVLFFCLDGGLALPEYRAADWPKEYRYASVLKQAMTGLEVPYYISRPIPFTRRFLALPEVTVSPQALALAALLDVRAFFVANTLALYAAGFAGLVLLSRRLALSALPFTLVFLIVFFNGHLTAHLAAGHSMWGGALLLPFFVLGVLDLVAGRSRAGLCLALALLAILLQGAYHVFVWCALFLALLGIARRRLFRPAVTSLALAMLLGAWRLAPAAFLVGRTESEFLSGFPGLRELARALLVIVPPGEPKRADLEWWEYDTYVGLPALALLLALGVAGRFRGPREGRYPELDVPLLGLVALSLGEVYRVITLAGVPLLATERVATRFLLLPVVFLGVLTAVRLEAALRGPSGRAWRLTALGVATATAVLLAAHSYAWRLAAVEAALPPRGRDLSISIVPPREVTDDPRQRAYLLTARLSALLSAAALAGTLAAARSSRSRPGRASTAP